MATRFSASLLIYDTFFFLYCDFTVEEEHTIQMDFFLFTLDSMQEIYCIVQVIVKKTSLQTYTHIFSVEVKMAEILKDLMI